jgi:16S rRNA processing protein RimM
VGSREEQGWLVVGVIRKPHGVHGSLLVDIETDFPERLSEGVRFGLGDSGGPTEFHEVHSVRYHGGQWLLSVKALRSRDEVECWRGRCVFLPEQALDDLPEGYYYEHHLVGLECHTAEGEVLGEVVGVESDTPQTRLVVRRGLDEYQVPYVPAIVTSVNVEGGTITLDAPPGLLDDDSVTA